MLCTYKQLVWGTSVLLLGTYSIILEYKLFYAYSDIINDWRMEIMKLIHDQNIIFLYS